MPRFFADGLPSALSQEELFALEGPEAAHISRSLRMAPGEELILCDGHGFDFSAVIDQITGDQVLCRLLDRTPSRSEPSVRLTLFQAMPKLDKLELITQKAVELGVSEIVPVLTSRCISRPDQRSFQKRRERLSKIAMEAAKQSGRGIIPAVGELLSFSQALGRMTAPVQDGGASPLALMCYEKEGRRMTVPMFENQTDIRLLVGCEGGFSPEEAEQAQTLGILPIWMGERILRCETAPLAALSVIQFCTGNL